ncbi:NUDIX hydrolase [bacterium]|nr:NUDIX hydrolase [bacterium]
MKIKKVNKVTDNQHLNLFEIEYTDMLGNDKKWQLVTRVAEPKCVSGDFKDPDAVVIVPYHKKKDRLVVIKEFRVPLGDYQFGFPAGLVDKGETLEEAGRRELKEETGLIMTRVLKVGPPIYSSSGMTDESISMLYVECEGESSNKHNESSEDISVVLMSPKEAAELCRDYEKKIDAKTWLVLSTFAEHGHV